MNHLLRTLICFTGLLALGCPFMPTPEHVEDASSKRDTICAFVEVWAVDRPELSRVAELCAAGEDLKTIAAAYAGCEVPSGEE